MAEAIQLSPENKAYHASVELMLTTLYRAAKTASIFKPEHPSVGQIAERARQVLLRTLGQEQNLTLDLKTNEALLDEHPLAATEEICAFAHALHTLGVGQILFTNRVQNDGMIRLFRWLLVKPDEKTSLTELQKQLQATRIDGLQLVFILSFVVTGDEENTQRPGQLSEEQIQAFISTETLPDFLALLENQNAKLIGREAEKVTEMLDDVRHRDLTLEKFLEVFPWGLYDMRIRAHFDRMRPALEYTPKTRDPKGLRPQGEPGWTTPVVGSWATLYDERDPAALKDHSLLDASQALQHCLAMVHRLIDRPTVPPQLRQAVRAYARLVADMGRAGDVAGLLKEFPRWKALAADKRLDGAVFASLLQRIQQGVANPAAAAQLMPHLSQIAKTAPEFPMLVEFIAFIGGALLPLLLEQTRELQDKALRQNVVSILAAVCRSLGSQTVLAALGDPDWLFVMTALSILEELGDPANLPAIASLLKHGHRRVREAAAKLLLRSGGGSYLDALAAYIEAAPESDEAVQTLIQASKSPHHGLDRRLLVSFERTDHYAVKVAIATALGRIADSEQAVLFLHATARRSWYELFTGLNKDLRRAARESLERLKKEGKA